MEIKDQEKQPKKSAFDDLLIAIGEFGRYQRTIYFLLCLPGISCALHTLAWVFVGGDVKQQCVLPNEVLDDNETWLKCELQQNSTCNTYILNTSNQSAVVEFDLICDNAWLRSIVDTLFMFGNLIGSFVFGTLSDRYGRKPTLYFALVLQLSTGVLSSISPNFTSFVALRTVLGSTAPGVYIVAYVLGIEMVGPGRRQYAGVLMPMFFSVGYMMTAFFAYLITDWRDLQLALSLPGLFFLVYWWFVPESPRWLIGQGRIAEAAIILQRIARQNKSKMSIANLDSSLTLVAKNEENESHVSSTSLLQLFSYPTLRRNTLVIFYVWFVNNLSYFGLAWNMNNLGGSHHINFVISGAVEIPAYILVMIGINSWGRQPVQSLSILMAGITLIITALVPPNLSWLQTTLAMLGKMAVTASCGTLYILSAEIFPTCVRNAGIGAAATFAAFGAMVAPFVILLSSVWQQLPFLLLGCVAVISGLLALTLPETLNKDLPDTLEEGEAFCRLKKNCKKLAIQATKF